MRKLHHCKNGDYISVGGLACSLSERVLYQVATPVPHTAVNAAGCRRLSSTPSPSRLLVAWLLPQVPHYVGALLQQRTP